MKKITTTFFAVLFAVACVCFFSTDTQQLFAEETANAVATESGYYKPYGGKAFASYRTTGSYTSPKLTASDCANYQNYLFAGWYTTSELNEAIGEDVQTTTETVYAKFVEASVLSVKCQVTQNTEADTEITNMRLISTTDSTNYDKVGFYVKYRGREFDCEEETLYKRIETTENITVGFSPVAFNEHSNYFFTHRLLNIRNAYFDEPFYIEPYWVTLDGTTVKGNSRYVRIEDSYNEIVNLPVNLNADAMITSGEISVTYDASKFELYTTDEYPGYDTGYVFTKDTFTNAATDGTGTLTYSATSTKAVCADSLFVNFRLKLKEGQLIESNTSFSVTTSFKNSDVDVTIPVSALLYKNYVVEYTGTSDTSWYDAYSDDKTFVLSTAADLYGLADIVNSGKDKFKGDKIILGADIVINDGTAFLNEDGTAGFTRTDGNPAYTWNPIGRYKTDATYTFEGTFNGNGHNISGIYAVDNTAGVNEGWYYGLFGATATTSVLQDFELINSTFVSEDGNGYSGSRAFMGSIAGQISGDIRNVRSSAYVVSTNGTEVGGFVGRINPSAGTSNIENCWFDGKIYTEFDAQKTVSVGGFAGTVFNTGTANIKDCHNTGNITCIYNATGTTAAGVAGFVGNVQHNELLKLNINNSMNNGQVKAFTTTDGGVTKTAYKKGVAGTIYNQNTGSSDGTTNVTMKNVIFSQDDSENLDNFYQASSSSVKCTSTNYEYKKEHNDYSGHAGYDTAARLGIYSYHTAKGLEDKGESLRWVVREDGIPQLKTFCEEWIDVGWYKENDYVIYTAEELYGFAVMSTEDTFSGDTVYLGADIKMNAGLASSWVKGNVAPDRKFTPIGKTKTFAGIFDGSYNDTIHHISGLYINDTSNSNGIGLFGQASGTVKNLKLENSCIFNNNTSKHNTGSVVGTLNSGALTNVYSDAYVVSNAGSGSQATGGMVGIFTGNANTISNCWFDGEVTSNGKFTGGIVGFVYSAAKTIDNCLNTGAVASRCETIGSVGTGGIVGLLDASNVDHYIKNSVNMGEVSSQKTGAGLELGSVIGDVKDPLTLQNVYTSVSTGGTIAGIGETVENTSTTATESTIDGTIDITGRPMVLAADDLTGANAYIYTELDFDSVWGAVEDGTIVLRDLYDGEVIEKTDLEQYQKHSTDWYCNNVAYGAALSDTEPTYTVLDVADFYGMSKIVNGGMTTFATKTVQLKQDTEYDLNEGWTVTVTDGTVTTSGTANKWTPIGTKTNKFNGKFDGCGNTIKGVYVDASTTINGLFGYGAASSNIQNFTLENSYFNVKADQVGAVAGVSEGSLKDIYVKENVAICNTKGYTGGLIGDSLGTNNNKTIENCWFDGMINSSGTNMGGFIGRVYAGTQTVTNALYTGDVYSTYAQGYYTGGFIGCIMGSATLSPSVYLTDCVGMGSVNVKVANGRVVGSVVGRSNTNTADSNKDRVDVHVNNVYTTDNLICAATINTNYAINGFGDMSYQYGTIYGEPIILDTDDLTGEQGYINTSLDFEDTWVATDDGVKLASFAEADVTNLADYQKVDLSWYYNKLIYSEGAKADGDEAYLGSKEEYQSEVDFEVSDAADMYGLAALVNNTACSDEKQSFNDMNISLTASVTFNNATEGNEAKAWYEDTKATPNSWSPIGNSTTNAFQGKFYGNGHTISGVYVESQSNYIGLFGVITDATIQNLRLENSYIKGKQLVGSIAGYGSGTFENVYSDAYVKGSRIIGGMIARVNAFTMTGCCYEGYIDVDYTGDGAYVGGMIAQSWSGTTSIDTCLYAGTIDCDITYSGSDVEYKARIGGFLANSRDDGTAPVIIKNSLSAGKIDTTVSTSNPVTTGLTYTGSLAGVFYGDKKVTVEDVYAVTEMVQKVGSGDGTTFKKLYSEGTTQPAAVMDADDSYTNRKEILTGLNPHLWTDLAFGAADRTNGTAIWAARQGKLPMPAELTTEDMDITIEKADTNLADQGSGSESDPYKISSVPELAGLALLSQTDNFSGKYFKLTDNIVINEGELAKDWAGDKAVPTLSWLAIGNASGSVRFAGSFDGDTHTISGISLEAPSTYLGLFNGTLAGSEIKNVRLQNSYIKQLGAGYTGSIVGDCRGTIENVYSNAIVESGNDQVGGIVGRANGINAEAVRISSTITDCWYDGVIRMTAKDQKQGGGIIGSLIQGEWTLTNCLFTGQIDCAYNGEENALVGGICGVINTPKSDENNTSASKLILNSCVSAGTITTVNTDRGVGAVVGRVKAEVHYDEETETVEEAVAYLEMTDVFATRSSAGYDIGSAETDTMTIGEVEYTVEPDITGDVVWTHKDDRLIGYCQDSVAEEIEVDSKSQTIEKDVQLNYDTEWIIRDKGTPVPATFEDLVTKVETTSLDSSIGLNVWNANLNTAAHYGTGRYVLTFGSASANSKTTYESYIDKLTSELGFSLHAGNTTKTTELSGTAVDGVYNGIFTNATGDWVLNVLYTENTGVTSITIHTGVQTSLSPNLTDNYAENTGEITFGMLKMKSYADNSAYYEKYPKLKSYYYGSSYVLQLAEDGHFIIIDGGDVRDYEDLIAYLQGLAGEGNSIHVDAWIVSHQHADHFSIMQGFYENPIEGLEMYVDAFYINEPNEYTKNGLYESLGSLVERQHRGIRTFKTSDNTPTPVYWYQTGQRYYFDGITMDVIQSQEQIALSDYAARSNGSSYKDYNTTSSVLLFTTDRGQKILTGGDATDANMKYIVKAYGETPELLSDINVFTALHHGKGTSYNIAEADNTFTDYLTNNGTNKFDVTLFPCSVYYDVRETYENEIHDIGAFPGAGAANKYLMTCSDSYYNYGSGNVIVTLDESITAEQTTE